MWSTAIVPSSSGTSLVNNSSGKVAGRLEVSRTARVTWLNCPAPSSTAGVINSALIPGTALRHSTHAEARACTMR